MILKTILFENAGRQVVRIGHSKPRPPQPHPAYAIQQPTNYQRVSLCVEKIQEKFVLKTGSV